MRVSRWMVIIYILNCMIISQSQDWTVWLYHPDDGLLLHLDNSGDILETRSVAQDEGYQRPHIIVFSDDQNLMATLSQSDNSFHQRLTLIDVDSRESLFVYDLPTPNNITLNRDDKLVLSENAFSPDGRQLAFVSFLGGIGWTIHIVDIQTSEISHSLAYNHPQVIAQPYLSSANIPQVTVFQDDMLSFYISNMAGNPSPQGHSYAWFLITDIVSETIAFPNANYDTLTTGEAIYPLPNKRFSSDNPPIDPTRLQHNVIYVYQTGEQSRYPSFVRPELDLLRTWFIQAGERILVEAWEDEIRTRWLIYDRSGTEIRNLPKAGYDISPTPDGFLYLTELDEKVILVNVDTRILESAGETVWVDEGTWQIISVTASLSNNLLPFAQLEKAETPPPLTTDASPTPFPTPLPLVYIGREMQIQVIDDGYINLRDTPSTDGTVEALLENGIYVDVIEGPVESGIYTWWKVGLSGREGWLVEAVNDTQILIPRRPVVEEDDSE